MSKNKILTLSLLWTALILVLVGIPGNQLPKLSDWTELFKPDKLIHVFVFAPFSYLWANYFYIETEKKNKAMAITLFFGIFYAAITELMQYYIFIGRNANTADAIADSLGVVLGLSIFIKKTLKNIITH